MPLAGRPTGPGTGVPVDVRGELNTTFIGLGDDGGYGGRWVPLAALKKVLHGILKYLGVLWLFSQLPELLTVILHSILKENEGSLLNLDHGQPALRFFAGGYVFAEFLKLIAWKKGIAPGQSAETAPSQRPRVELCLESHMRSNTDGLVPQDNAGQCLSDKPTSTVAKSNIHYDRPHNAVDFGLTVVLDPASI